MLSGTGNVRPQGRCNYGNLVSWMKGLHAKQVKLLWHSKRDKQTEKERDREREIQLELNGEYPLEVEVEVIRPSNDLSNKLECVNINCSK